MSPKRVQGNSNEIKNLLLKSENKSPILSSSVHIDEDTCRKLEDGLKIGVKDQGAASLTVTTESL